jgi:hypothetical protein
MVDIGKFQPATNVDDAWSAVDEFPLQPGDPRYVDCSQVRGTDTVGYVERILQRHARAARDLHLLFTGYRGNGKTTELYYFKSRIDHEYEVIYFDASKGLDLENLALTDLLLGIANETMDHMKKAGYRLPDNLLEAVGDWFFDRVFEKSQALETEIGGKAEVGIPVWVSFITAKVFSGMKMSTDEREIMRRKLERNLKELIDKVNSLLVAAREQVRLKNRKDLLMIMDSMDRMRAGLEKNLFYASGGLLKELKGNFIYVVPISLLFDPQARLLPFDEHLILPMIPIYKMGQERMHSEMGISHLRDLISKRTVVDMVFTDPQETVEKLILASGGHLRDLMRLLNYACNETDDKITSDHANTAINMLVRDYERVVRDDEYPHLVEAYKTQNPPNNPINQDLIYHNVILEYCNLGGTEWKDVHPAVIRNAKFQQALQQK